MQQHIQTMCSIISRNTTSASTLSSLERSNTPNDNLYRVKTVPGLIKFLIRRFCSTPTPHSMQLWAGLDYNGPGVWGPEKNAKSLHGTLFAKHSSRLTKNANQHVHHSQGWEANENANEHQAWYAFLHQPRGRLRKIGFWIALFRAPYNKNTARVWTLFSGRQTREPFNQVRPAIYCVEFAPGAAQNGRMKGSMAQGTVLTW